MTDKIQKRPVLWAALAYFVLTLYMTIPLIRNFFTHSAGGSSDDMVYLWNLWWTKHALVDLGTNPFYTDYIFTPHETSLAFHSYHFFYNIVTLPLQWVLPLHVIHNLIVVSSFVLAGLGAFLLIDHLVRHRGAAFIGGLVFTFSPFHLTFATGNRGGIQWIPFYCLFLLKAVEGGRVNYLYAAAAGLFLGITLLTAHTYFIFLLIFTALYITGHLVLNRKAPDRALALNTAVVAVVAFLTGLPLIIELLRQIAAGDFSYIPLTMSGKLASGAQRYAIDALALLSPDERNPLLGGLSFAQGLAAGERGGVYLGISVLALAAAGLFSSGLDRRTKVLWGTLFVVFTLFSMGSALMVAGRKVMPFMPFDLFQHVPVLRNMRVPSRFSVMTMLCLGVLAAAGVSYILRSRTGARALTAVIAGVVLIEYSMLPFPMHRIEVPEVYYQIRDDRKARTVLEAPMFVQDGFGVAGLAAPEIQYYQTVHRKRIFNGYIARLPYEQFRYSMFNLPLVRSIYAMQGLIKVNEQMLRDEVRMGREVIGLFGIDYIVVHKRLRPEHARSMQNVQAYIEYALDVEKIYEDADTVAYRTVREPGGSRTIDLGTAESVPYLFQGWINGQQSPDGTSYAWMAGDECSVLLDLEAQDGYELKLRARPYDQIEDTRVDVSLNGSHLATLELMDGWQEYSLELDHALVRDGLNTIGFRPMESRRGDMDFGGAWSKGMLFNMTIPYPNVKERPLSWEQMNTKFKGWPVSAAVDRLVLLKNEIPEKGD